MMQLQEKKPKEKCENLGEERGEMNSGCKKSGRKKATPKTPGLILLASPMYFHLTDYHALIVFYFGLFSASSIRIYSDIFLFIKIYA
jgi:tRNA pseudouridine38/39 synthase